MNRKNILFISNTIRINRPFLDPSVRYRCFNLANELNKRGYSASVISLANFEKCIKKEINYFDDIDLFYFHRPRLNNILGYFLEKRKLSDSMIIDFDDFIFSTADALVMPNREIRDPMFESIPINLANNAAACHYFSQFTATTYPLIEKYKKLFNVKKSAIIPNNLDAAYINISNQIRKNKKEKSFKLGYFPGTTSHDADLQYISQSLEEVFLNSDSNLFILGPVKIPDNLMKFENRIVHKPNVVSFYELPHIMSQVETVLAPLQENEFNKCKSGIKFFEAAVLGCNVIATPIPDIDRFETPYLRKPRNQDEWLEALSTPFNEDHEQKEHVVNKLMEQLNPSHIADIFEEVFINER